MDQNHSIFITPMCTDLLLNVNDIITVLVYTVSQKTSPTFLAVTRESIAGFS